MNTPSRLLVCTASLVAGAGLAWLFAPARPQHSTGGDGPGRASMRSGKTPGREEGEGQRLRQLARDPFIDLSDGEIAALADRLDLRREENIHLLNGILHPELRRRVWQACLEASVDQFTLPELFQLAVSARLAQESGTTFDCIFERVVAEGGQEIFFLGNGQESPLLASYADYCSRRSGSLAEANALLPMAETSDLSRMLEPWLRNHPGGSGLRDLLQLSSAESGGYDKVNAAICQSWPDLPVAERPAVLDEVAKLPPGRRNWLLRSIAMLKVPKDDPGQLVQVIGDISSFRIHQEILLRGLSSDASRLLPDAEAVEGVIRQIDMTPDADRYGKIRGFLDEWLRTGRPPPDR